MSYPIFTRLNERSSRPNEHINFIHALPTPGGVPTSSDVEPVTHLNLLNQVAAFCQPIMKTHSLRVNRLTEHASNPEFLGRNFNAGALIELVLRKRNGALYSFRQVCLVMAHELAHCRHMNHGPAFWKFCKQLEGEMRELWRRRYVGDGVWGAGRVLENGVTAGLRTGVTESDDDLPEQLCGGTFRSAKPGRTGRTSRKTRQRGQTARTAKTPTAAATTTTKRATSGQGVRTGRAVSSSGSGPAKSRSLSRSRSDTTPASGLARVTRRRVKSAMFKTTGFRVGASPLGLDVGSTSKAPEPKPRVASSKRCRELRMTALTARLEQRRRELADMPTEMDIVGGQPGQRGNDPDDRDTRAKGGKTPAGRDGSDRRPDVIVLDSDSDMDDDNDNPAAVAPGSSLDVTSSNTVDRPSASVGTAASPCPSLMTDLSTDGEDEPSYICLDDDDGDGMNDSGEGNGSDNSTVSLERLQLDPLFSRHVDGSESDADIVIDATGRTSAADTDRSVILSADDLGLGSTDDFTFRRLGSGGASYAGHTRQSRCGRRDGVGESVDVDGDVGVGIDIDDDADDDDDDDRERIFIRVCGGADGTEDGPELDHFNQHEVPRTRPDRRSIRSIRPIPTLESDSASVPGLPALPIPVDSREVLPLATFPAGPEIDEMEADSAADRAEPQPNQTKRQRFFGGLDDEDEGDYVF